MCFSNQLDMPDFLATLDAMAPAPVAAPVLPEFSVTLNFRKGPAFTTVAKGATEDDAISAARLFAKLCGVAGAERKPTVYEVQA